MKEFIGPMLLSFFACFFLVPLLLGVIRMFGLYAVIQERRCHVYVLFGRVIGTLDEPGLYFLPLTLGWQAFIVKWLGKCYVLDMRLDQKYLRSQPVNSEEGAPMGIGIWYEMFISDPTSYLFKNADPVGSLAANVSSSTVRCLSNLPLDKMMTNRHAMSHTVREEVSPKSHEWGYKLGSVYIRKVHFRDAGMVNQIESKVVNRLRQVTAAITQDGVNRVSIIHNAAERQAAVEFAKAGAIRPQIVGSCLQKISEDPEVAGALFEILETQKILDNQGKVTIVPKGSPLLTDLLASTSPGGGKPASQAPSGSFPDPSSQPKPPPVRR